MILKMDLNVYNDKTQSGGVEISFIGSMNDKTQYGWDQNVVHPTYEQKFHSYTVPT